ncbi:nicotinamide riboside transporter PnuC [Pedobacter sp. MC2016-14]|uniref:nicotinamide riboside transporter PnuC n=1 Tax=Pedobacter sp. MC2016-14 TaxID=2897327 RepID=UPI001E3E6BE1|nr:nicotinamide riboside transporter PnuC [Pedobacter sp. MC2016-14]MCD0487732.1 nicotinamide riboside transporter PnuC [Pedobacter sp. MC2016-14]
MSIKEWYELFSSQIGQTGLIEWLAVGFGVSEVILAKKNNIWLYPTGIISVTLSMFILLDVKLYAETLLNGYYLVMSAYGWIVWKKRKGEPPLAISRSNGKELGLAFLICMVGFAVLYTVLRLYTDSDVIVWDAFVSATAWAGMWLLARRKIENWIFLNVSNLFAIPLLVHKNLPMYALLTVILFIVAIFGFFEWKMILNKRQLKPVG